MKNISKKNIDKNIFKNREEVEGENIGRKECLIGIEKEKLWFL